MSIHGAIAVGVAALALALCATGARRYLSCRARRAGLYLAAMPVMLLNLVRLVGLVKVIAVTQSVTKVAKWLGAARTAKAVDGALDWISRPLWPKDIPVARAAPRGSIAIVPVAGRGHGGGRDAARLFEQTWQARLHLLTLVPLDVTLLPPQRHPPSPGAARRLRRLVGADVLVQASGDDAGARLDVERRPTRSGSSGAGSTTHNDDIRDLFPSFPPEPAASIRVASEDSREVYAVALALILDIGRLRSDPRGLWRRLFDDFGEDVWQEEQECRAPALRILEQVHPADLIPLAETPGSPRPRGYAVFAEFVSAWAGAVLAAGPVPRWSSATPLDVAWMDRVLARCAELVPKDGVHVYRRAAVHLATGEAARAGLELERAGNLACDEWGVEDLNRELSRAESDLTRGSSELGTNRNCSIARAVTRLARSIRHARADERFLVDARAMLATFERPGHRHAIRAPGLPWSRALALARELVDDAPLRPGAGPDAAPLS